MDCGTALDHFAESAEVISLIASLPQANKELRSRETSEEKFTGGEREMQGTALIHKNNRFYNSCQLRLKFDRQV